MRVLAASRLHFGLLDVPDDHATPRRVFGGCGLMVDPGSIILTAQPAAQWDVQGRHADRVRNWANAWTTTPHRIRIERCPDQHIGLGVGTALSMSLAKVLFPHETIAQRIDRTGRGQRSGIGVHGFEQGGFLIDIGKRPSDTYPKLFTRIPFPTAWRIVLIRAATPPIWHGEIEQHAFARRRQAPVVERIRQQLASLLFLEIWPSILDQDFPCFCQSLCRYNQLAGQFFEDDQHGEYSHPAIKHWLSYLHQVGVTGTGQSSWGPTMYAFARDQDHATEIVQLVEQAPLPVDDCRIVQPCNHGAELIQEELNGSDQPNIEN